MHGYIWPINFSRTRTATRACGVTTPDCGEGSQASQLVAAWLVAGADEVEVNLTLDELWLCSSFTVSVYEPICVNEFHRSI